MITIELMGGLGNQLFQVCTLLSYCFDTKRSFALIKSDILYGPIRNYDVYWGNIFRNLKPFFKNSLNLPIKYKEPHFHYSKLPDIPDNSSIWGYYQSHRYFDHHKDTIMRLLDINGLKEQVKNKWSSDELSQSISMHFRIGDYAKLQQYHCLLDLQYYIDSIKYLIKTTNKDDWNIVYCCEKENLQSILEKIDIMNKQFPNVTFKRVSDDYMDWEQMLIMSLCQHNIIANSSFSWWASYLNDNSSQIVCCPKTWFGPAYSNKKTDDLYLKDWVKI